MQNINSTNTLVVTDPIMSPLFTGQLISMLSYNALSSVAKRDIVVVPYNKAAYRAMLWANSTHPNNTNVVYNVTENLRSYL
jgi:hypothetical protein